MLKSGSWDATAAAAQLVPANTERAELVISLHSGDPVFLGFGKITEAVASQGIALDVSVDKSIRITGVNAQKAVYGVCADTNTASGGYQEM